MMNENMISRLIDKGCRRWTKGEHDRLYIDPEILGLSVERYKTGNISYAEFRGERISNSYGAELAEVKAWIDLKTGEIHARGYKSSARNTMIDAAIELVEAIEAEITAEELAAAETTEPENAAEECEVYYIANAEHADAIYGDQLPTCMSLREVARLAREWDMTTEQLLNQMHEADEDEIREYGVYNA